MLFSTIESRETGGCVCVLSWQSLCDSCKMLNRERNREREMRQKEVCCAFDCMIDRTISRTNTSMGPMDRWDDDQVKGVAEIQSSRIESNRNVSSFMIGAVDIVVVIFSLPRIENQKRGARPDLVLDQVDIDRCMNTYQVMRSCVRVVVVSSFLSLSVFPWPVLHTLLLLF